MSNIQAKLDLLAKKLEGGREDQIREVQAMEKVVKNALLKQNLKDHPAMILFLQTMKKREEGYHMLLANNPMDEKRVEWFARREECRFLTRFFEVESRLKTIESDLDYQLSDDTAPVDNTN